MPASEQKLEKIKELLKLKETGGNDKDLFFLDKIQELIDEIKRETLFFGKELQQIKQGVASVENTISLVKKKVGVKGDKGDKGETIIGSKGPPGPPGLPGKAAKPIEPKRGDKGDPGLPGQDGKDADEEKIVKEVMDKIDLPEVKIDTVKGLKEELEDLRDIRGRGVGGTSAMGVAQAFKLILKTEAPSGAIDGANKTYTVNQPIFAVLAFSLSGEVIPQIPNYTISNKTITFSTALPAAYSGKAFEIKYI